MWNLLKNDWEIYHTSFHLWHNNPKKVKGTGGLLAAMWNLLKNDWEIYHAIE
jgi:hypothetical protein